MLIRSLASTVIVASSFVIATGQTLDAKKENADKTARSTTGIQSEKLRDIPFGSGVDLRYLISGLARDMDLNVLFDPETFPASGSRKTSIELKNVTAKAALDYLLVQEGLVAEELGPRTILVASRSRVTSIPRIGLGITLLTEQLAQYFGVERGILVNNVRLDSPGSKAGLKAGDVIVGFDGETFPSSMALIRAIADKKESNFTLTIVRDHRERSVSVIGDSVSP